MDNEFYELYLDGSYKGPLDLLYYLMNKEEISFEKISIAKIADQYLEYIKNLEDIDLYYAGDFLDLASRLVALKARELLPKEDQSKEDLLNFEMEREALILEMQEHQKFKRVALGLKEMEDKNFGTYGRGRMEKISKDSQLADANIWQLFKAFNKALQVHTYKTSIHTIEVDKVPIEDRQQHINAYLSQRGRALFDDLLGKERVPIMIAVTFMAMLELTKTDDIVFRQSEVNGPLWLYRKKQNDEYKEELAREKMYYTPNPTLKEGLANYLQSRSSVLETKEKNSLDSILKTAMQLIESGMKLEATDIQAMLEGTMPNAQS